MSLVNDMLRDLDARRRETPSGKPGAPKLVAATEKQAVKKRYGLIAIMALLTVVLVGVISAFLIQWSENQGSLTVAPPVASVSGSNQVVILPDTTQVETMPAGTAQGNPVPVSTPPAAVASEALSQLEIRLQQLEAQNRALLEAQQREEQLLQAQSQAIVIQQPSAQLTGQTPVQPTAQTTGSAQSAASPNDAWINQAWADAPALPAEGDNELIAGSTTTATTRSTRQLSLAERDRQQVQLALQHWSSGLQLAALQTLDAFTFQNPDAHNSRETLAKLLIQQGELERAMQAVELGLAIAPNQNGYRKLKARLLLESGGAVEAVNLLASSAPLVSSDPEYHDLLASAYLASQQYESAATTYQSLLQQNSAEGRWWYGMAASLDASGRTADALIAYERALQQSSLSQSLRQISQQRLQAIRQSQSAL